MTNPRLLSVAINNAR